MLGILVGVVVVVGVVQVVGVACHRGILVPLHLTLRSPHGSPVPLIGSVRLLVARPPCFGRPHHVQEPLGGGAQVVQAGDHRPDGNLCDNDQDEQDADAMHPVGILDASLRAGVAVALGGLLPHVESHPQDEAEGKGDEPPEDDHEIVSQVGEAAVGLGVEHPVDVLGSRRVNKTGIKIGLTLAKF